MKTVCLMPTYGRPRMVQNAIQCFLDQTHKDATLLILDDAGQIPRQDGERWVCYMEPIRLPGMFHKYRYLLKRADEVCPAWELAVVWDDDDIYLPQHIESHIQAVEAMPEATWSHPTQVLSDYTGKLAAEGAAGRFHGALAVRRLPLLEMGGWVNTLRADFDQQFITRCAEHGPQADPCTIRSPQYIFRWGGTGHPHCQHYMSSPDNETWWDRYAEAHKFEPWGDLVPGYDQNTVQRLTELEVQATTAAGQVASVQGQLMNRFGVK